jgi:hypothetical protein
MSEDGEVSFHPGNARGIRRNIGCFNRWAWRVVASPVSKPTDFNDPSIESVFNRTL